MLFLLSPAKSLDFDTPVPAALRRRMTEPLFPADTEALVGLMRQRSADDVAALMDLSPTLAELNVARYAAWRPEPRPRDTRPALLGFDGDVYQGLQAHTLDGSGWRWAQQRLVVLSGLYGVLRPLDRLQPYRLEMGTALPSARGRDLYAWWGDRIAAHLNERLATERRPVVVNLASVEYARAALRPALKARVVDCVFEEWKDEGWKIVSFFAKRARGLMARWAIDQRAATPARLRQFDVDGYAYDAQASTADRLVFRRRSAPA